MNFRPSPTGVGLDRACVSKAGDPDLLQITRKIKTKYNEN